MECPIKKPNKSVRILFGIAIIALGVLFESWLGAIGSIPILFALVGYCPVCQIAQRTKKEHPNP